MSARPAQTEGQIEYATAEEGRALFDHQARALLGISGDEFLERWERGEYRDVADTPDNRHIVSLAMLIPFARADI